MLILYLNKQKLILLISVYRYSLTYFENNSYKVVVFHNKGIFLELQFENQL